MGPSPPGNTPRDPDERSDTMPTSDTPWAPGTPCWVDCQVEDTTSAREFYAELFGWDILDSPAEAGGYLMAMLHGKAAAGIGAKDPGQPFPSSWTTYIASEDVDATEAAVTTAGGQIVVPAFDVMTAGRMSVIADPTGGVAGVWQAGEHLGAGIVNEPGALCWNELHTRDYAAAKSFYTDVFGYGYTPMSPTGADEGYVTFALPGGEGPVGGIADDNAMPDAPNVPAHWLTWFAVGDADVSAALAAELGGSVLMPPSDSPIGRMAVVAGREGEAFGLIALQSA